MRYISPLRYPGGKSKLANYIKLIIKMNLLNDGDYIEPYVGGASIGLDLLMNEYVRNIFINDVDYTIYAFWYSILNLTDIFCKKIFDTKINLNEWKKQKHIYNNYHKYSIIEIGFSTFFLNRTNRSGILNGGVIGGYNQESKWRIDARFNKNNLVKRINLISHYRDRIRLFNLDAIDFLKNISTVVNKKSFYYLDPPYYNKGKDLYLNYYQPNDHRNIYKYLSKDFNKKYWILTYDNVDVIRNLYKDFRSSHYNINYYANTYKKGEEIMFYSDNINYPKDIIPSDNLRIKYILTEKIYY